MTYRPPPPIFSTPSRRRRWALRSIAGALLIGTLFILLAGIAGVTVRSRIELPQLVGSPLPGPGISFTKAHPLREHHLLPANAFSRPMPPPNKALPEIIRAASLVYWDSDSLTSFRRNHYDLNVVFPESLFLTKNPGELAFARHHEAEKFMKSSGLAVVPILSNFIDGVARRDVALQLMTRRSTQTKLLRELRLFISANPYVDGVLLDIEGIEEEHLPSLAAFAHRLRNQLRRSHRELIVGLESGLPLSSVAAVASATDYIFLRHFREHTESSEPGPPSTIRSPRDEVLRLQQVIAPESIINGIPAFGYDWVVDDYGSELSFQSAIVRARDVNHVPTYDPIRGGLFYRYTDEHGVAHDVWVPDAATTFQQLRALADVDSHHAAIWRLGFEDARLWRFWKRDLSLRSLAADPLPSDLLSRGQLVTDIERDGVGDIFTVSSEPIEGTTTIDYDRSNHSIRGQSFVSLPTAYHLRRFGHSDTIRVLTFDDGPDPNFTPQILYILSAKDVKVVFFVIGTEAQLHAPLVRRMIREGHAIGNHSTSHPHLDQVAPERVRLEIGGARSLIEALTGRSTILFRTPFDVRTFFEHEDELAPHVIASRMNFVSVGASIDPRDWEEGVTPDQLVRRVVDQLDAGPIILLHDGGGNRDATIAALPRIIDAVRERGYFLSGIDSLMHVSPEAIMPPLKESSEKFIATATLGAATLVVTIINAGSWLFVCIIFLIVIRTVLIALLAILHAYCEAPRPTSNRPNPVSVLIPAHNEGMTIAKTIEALQRSSAAIGEIIVIDDGSTDNTADEVRKLQKLDFRITLLCKPNEGKAAALSRGIETVHTDFVVCIDADTQLAPDAITALMSAFVDHNVAAVAGNVRVGNPHSFIGICQSIEYVVSQNFERRAFDLLGCVTVIPGAIGAYRVDVLRGLGGYRSDTLAEDCDLTLRIQERGFRVRYAPEAIALTEAPQTIRLFLRQRFRWTFGTLQNLWKHRHMLFARQQKALGLIALPNIIIFQFLIPLLAPVVDLVVLASLLSGSYTEALQYFVLFSTVEIIAAMLAYSLEGEFSWRIVTLPLQRFWYRQLLYITTLIAVVAAFRGGVRAWGQQRRRGDVALVH